MLTNLLKYKGSYARIAFDPSADAFHGRVIGIQDVIDFYGRTPDELRGVQELGGRVPHLVCRRRDKT
jgi:predicted HicB family RNase H-like nuclease